LWPFINAPVSSDVAILTALVIAERARATGDAEAELLDARISFVISHAVYGLSDDALPMKARRLLGSFILHAFQNIHILGIQQAVQPLVSIAIWSSILESFREELFKETPVLRKRYNKSCKAVSARDAAWLSSLVAQVLRLLQLHRQDEETIHFCSIMLEFFALLLLQLPTRRYTYYLFIDSHFLALAGNSARMQQAENVSLRSQFEVFQQAMRIPYDNIAGRSISGLSASQRHSAWVSKMQRIAFMHFKDKLLLTALANHSSATGADQFAEQLKSLSFDELRSFCGKLHIRVSVAGQSLEQAVLIRACIERFAAPLTTSTLFQKAIVPSDRDIDLARSLPPSTLQFLSVPDLLSRQFEMHLRLYRQKLRAELSDTLTRLVPVVQGDRVNFKGNSKNAKHLKAAPVILEVLPPIIGQNEPSRVLTEIKITLGTEWMDLRTGELLSFITLGEDGANGFIIRHLRTAFVDVILKADPNGVSNVRLLMDPVAYEADERLHIVEKVYASLKTVIRRPKSKRGERDHVSLNKLTALGKFSESPISDTFADVLLGLSSESAPVAAPDPSAVTGSLKHDLSEAQLAAVDHCLNHSVALVNGVATSGKTSVLATVAHRLCQSANEKVLCLVADDSAAIALEAMLQDLGTPDILICNSSGALDFDQDAKLHVKVERFREQSLQSVGRLASAMGIAGDHAASCEAAAYFYQNFIEPATRTEKGQDANEIHSFEQTHGNVTHFFQEVEQCRPMEYLRTPSAKSKYVLSTLARITIVTVADLLASASIFEEAGCTLKAILVDDANRVEELCTLIAVTLSKASELKRMILFGNDDHLRPDTQSLFTRLIRTQVPCQSITRRFGIRPELIVASATSQNDPMSDVQAKANAGLSRVYQLINVTTYSGQNETEPRPGYIQNLGEAEYVVALYQYMRLLNYPIKHIALVTFEKGQCALINDIVNTRCRGDVFGRPRISTVRDLAQSYDYVLLSCTRTKAMGSLLDKRLMKTALSRARLGLYVFARTDAIKASQCWPSQLEAALPADGLLHLVIGEMFGTCKRKADEEGEFVAMSGADHLGQYVYEMTKKRMELHQ
jgi:hypothetical protein